MFFLRMINEVTKDPRHAAISPNLPVETKHPQILYQKAVGNILQYSFSNQKYIKIIGFLYCQNKWNVPNFTGFIGHRFYTF